MPWKVLFLFRKKCYNKIKCDKGGHIMDLKNLHCFIAVAEQLNFSRAAESLFLSQPSLSIRIKALEDELHTKLFHRTHQEVSEKGRIPV